MAQIYYSYDPVTNIFLGTGQAKLSPLDLAQGKEVHLIPRYSTIIAPPEAKAGFLTVWDGQKWIQKLPDLIQKSVTKQLCKYLLEQELRTAFPNIKVVLAGDVEAATARTIVFHNIPDTPENNTTLDTLIASHVLPDTTIEELGEVQLAAFQVLCEEMRKINPSFPAFATFSQLVNTKLQTKE